MRESSREVHELERRKWKVKRKDKKKKLERKKITI